MVFQLGHHSQANNTGAMDALPPSAAQEPLSSMSLLVGLAPIRTHTGALEEVTGTKSCGGASAKVD